MPKKTWTTPIHALRTIVVDTDEGNPAVEIYAVEGATLDELPARAYLGEITINDHQAAEIWNELQNCRATHLEHSIIVRAEVFLTVLATVVEI